MEAGSRAEFPVCMAGLLKSSGKMAGFREEGWAPRLGALAELAGPG